jgi:superfamily II DNA or RNA helicase/HKD family nuclease
MPLFRFRLGDDGEPRRTELPDGLYEDVVSDALASHLDQLAKSAEVGRAPLSGADAVEHLSDAIHQAARIALDSIQGQHAETRRLGLANDLLHLLQERSSSTLGASEARLRSELLLHVARRGVLADGGTVPARPSTPLARSDLFVNAEKVGVVSEIRSEIESADRIDFIVAFIKWSGLVKFRDELAKHCQRGRPLRVLTTTYVGATEARAVAELRRLGAQVKVAHEDVPTRLHAKAWLFQRDTGLSTAYVGSSNLSRSAMTDGIEWNVRIAGADLPHVVEKFDAVFRRYWDDPASGFTEFDGSAEAVQRLEESLRRARGQGNGSPMQSAGVFAFLDVQPRDFQRHILSDLALARSRGHTNNLVVAATGTGKTVVAALDYRRLRREGVGGKKVETLLFVAHRESILQQSRDTFRAVLREPTFGELLVDGQRPQSDRHVFASIQSLGRRIDELDPAAFDLVVVDEVHHGAAPTYDALLTCLKPAVLLGLTATPERMDDRPGDSLQLDKYFDRPWASELRLWEAIDRQILVPFNYFAVDDGTDVRKAWQRGRYSPSELENVYGADRIWVRNVARAVDRYVKDPGAMRAIAFCAGVSHARLAASELEKVLEVPCVSVTGEDDTDFRRDMLRRFESDQPDRPRILCVVDLLNEGVDLPRADTLLLMRPTESATVFIQQLGRGLRRTDDKDCLTVLDFVGHQHEDFRFERRYGRFLGMGRAELRTGLKEGFPHLPSGCFLQFEEKPREQILRALQRVLKVDTAALASRLKETPEAGLDQFLTAADLTLPEFFRDDRSWTEVVTAAGRSAPSFTDDQEREALFRVQRLIHVDDPWRLETLAKLAEGKLARTTERELRMARMLLVQLYKSLVASNDKTAGALLTSHARLRAELTEIVSALKSRTEVIPADPVRSLPPDVPLHLHARYRTEEITAAFDLRSRDGNLYTPQMGVVPAGKYDLLLVTLDKGAKKKLPHLQYRDYALSPRLFHWQSQASATRDSTAGKRHLDPAVVPLLFVREASKDDRGLGVAYRFLGAARRVDDRGERPISITFELLDGEIPADLLVVARAAVA